MKTKIKVPVLPIFKPLYHVDKGVAILMSGRGTGKTWAVSRLAIQEVLENDGRVAVLRDEKTKVKETILRDIKSVFESINEKMNGFLNGMYTFTDQGLTNNITKTSQIFTLGFRASSKDDKTKLKGLSDVDLVIIDEAEDVRDEAKVNILMDTVVRSNALVIFILNTPDKDHWIIRKYFTLQDSGHEGYFVPEPKQIDGVHYFLPTYKDNNKLNAEAVALYESYGDPKSDNYDIDHYLASIQGLVSEGRKGRIFKDWKRISVKDYLALDYHPSYGMDFGFSNDPTALIEIKEHNRKLYLRQRIYRHQMTNDDIGDEIKELGINDLIIADSSEPKSIEELSRMNIRVVGADKTRGSVNAGISKIQAMREVYVCEDSNELWDEYLNYVWQLDKNKRPTNDPEDANNHGMDAIRYGIKDGAEFSFMSNY